LTIFLSLFSARHTVTKPNMAVQDVCAAHILVTSPPLNTGKSN
jgi:hypothetical protein